MYLLALSENLISMESELSKFVKRMVEKKNEESKGKKN